MYRSIYWKFAALAAGSACVLWAQGPGGHEGRPGFGFGGGLGIASFLGKTVAGAPFSANLTTQFTHILANGNTISQQETAEVYRDNQGRVAINATITRPASSGTQTVNTITIDDPIAGYIYRLNPAKMTGVKTPIPQRTSAPPTGTRPTDPNVTTTTLPASTINGVSATGTQVTRTIPAGTIGNAQAIQIVRVTWVSTALQIPVQITVTDPRSGKETMNLTNIVQSEPSASFFTVPSSYTITTAQGRGPGPAFRRRQ